MRWTRGYKSDQVDDRRASGGSGGSSAAGLGALTWLFSRFGLPGVLVGGVVLYLTGNLGLGMESRDQDPEQSMSSAADDPEKEAVSFVSFVLDDVQKSWSDRFAASQQKYVLSRLVLFRGSTSSACGLGERAMGPFYCSRDRNVYIDLSFYRELKDRFGAPGDFAQAYVIAHEVGHHVQHLLGLDEKVREASPRGAQGETGASVRLELQADCLAGIWAHSTERRSLLEAGDIEEALKAAAAIGDDKLQGESTGTVRPETFTHGSSAQRMRWFKNGYESGKLEACDTFTATQL
jgi:predicted metalloprotease